MYTIIIANYNRTKELKRCLDSVEIAFNGTIQPEIIVIEDGSSDILKDCRISKHILLNTNGGPVRARLEGAKKAKHEYILLLDSDDTLLESALLTIEDIRACHPSYDLYGFTFKGGESSVDFDIQSIDDYCDFVSFEGRTSDYLMIVKANVLKKYVCSHSYRLSEIWLFSEIFIKHTAFYSRQPIFNYHQDAQEQLSKKRNFQFKWNKYEYHSVSMSVKYFISFLSVYKSKSFFNAWRRRLIKESILTFNLKAFKDVLCLKK